MEKFKKVSVEETAKIMGKAPQFIRCGLQQGRLPFGSAVKIGEKKWDYHISEAALEEYLSGKMYFKNHIEEFKNIAKAILDSE